VSGRLDCAAAPLDKMRTAAVQRMIQRMSVPLLPFRSGGRHNAFLGKRVG
jgi:hypothetical protein